MTRPQPARDNTCPSCGQDVGDGYYSQRKTCNCGTWLICIMGSPSPRWILLRDYDPQEDNRLTDDQAWHWFEAVEGRPMEEP